MIRFENKNCKPAPDGLDYLISNGVIPILFFNNRQYNSESGKMIAEADIIIVVVTNEQEDMVSKLMNQWLNT